MIRLNRHRSKPPQPTPQPASYKRGEAPTGHQVAAFDRPARHLNEWSQELRVTVKATEDGRPFASLRVLKRYPNTGECDGVIAALTEAINLARNPAGAAKILANSIQIGMALLGLPAQTRAMPPPGRARHPEAELMPNPG